MTSIHSFAKIFSMAYEIISEETENGIVLRVHRKSHEHGHGHEHHEELNEQAQPAKGTVTHHGFFEEEIRRSS
ncbi:hypothetical protein BOTNAR_0308g00100 [Botryotinia narcissicola]|uniref:Uncharacterized protein n=1 Tax=Botryotinia narcissicola TaxID=278944 RepID=A0A4Z1HVD8_9HELO|nr:hypothetical protein BOTNAR_0308g00100 [Botryotinia narcissicola]